MQEEVENRTLTLMVSGTKFSGRLLKAAICKYMAHRKEVKNQNGPCIRQFDRIARKYGVDYAVRRDRNSNPPKFLIFFKGRDNDAITAVFQEYAGKKVRKASRPSVLQKLAVLKTMVRDSTEKIKKKVLER